MNEQFWWYVARASGLVAWALAVAAVLWGVALATRALGDKPKAPWLLDLHRHLGGLTVLFTGLHMAALVADSYAHFGLADLLVPFASEWQPGAVAWGVLAFWLLLGVEVTSLLMKRIPKRWWRRIHLTAYIVAVSATVHLFTAGTDGTTTALRWATIVLGAGTAFFLLYREMGPAKRSRVSAGARTASAEAAATPEPAAEEPEQKPRIPAGARAAAAEARKAREATEPPVERGSRPRIPAGARAAAAEARRAREAAEAGATPTEVTAG